MFCNYQIAKLNTRKIVFFSNCEIKSPRNLILLRYVFDMITGINESCKCESKLDGRKSNPNQKLNNDKCRCECKNLRKHHVCKRDYIWNPATGSCETDKYLASTADYSMITCDKIIKETKTIPKNFNEKKITCKI